MSDPGQHLRDRAAALAGELSQLKREAVLTDDLELNVRLKEVRRALKMLGGVGPFTDEAYDRLKERLADELYGEADSEERVIKARKESLTANVRHKVEAELAADRAALEQREAIVAARERKATPSYRAAFLAAGAVLTLSADVLVRLVA